jgi:hypothetical protein
MNQVATALECFDPTTLGDMNAIKLLKRYDTKFVFHRERLGSIFNYLSGRYNVLEIGKKRVFRYVTTYFDTDDYFFYHQHHNKKLNRYKVRCRKYIDSDQCFFEVKFKNNHNKTIKSRLPLTNGYSQYELSDDSKKFARSHIAMNGFDIVGKIKPKLTVEYDRITFANTHTQERLTVDSNLAYKDMAGRRKAIKNMVITELKSEKFSPNSALYQHLKAIKIAPTNFSKYCMGIAMTEKEVKYNRFKKKLSTLQHLS